ncbi:MAG: hypothetical protein COZ12_03175 [Deltaproteobacteria bacterium CG_4_10_14_3_um_filter_60_8]|nr:MAG: hypothetical protein AUK28_10455 [Desulfobacterales bacterium CG2_30_60_27]PIP43083.1 MAG: hypothetical protein COX17_08990 [Deltaproteobacteria bacterium CG23_combo_of_CG06-09_8_20_14_all_60_8]PIY22380.1 MAG: hypothetical protein COZ12_03175 [Deltaproteobacteria bacterium CG_4_10_14_3_um_filter_60_8]
MNAKQARECIERWQGDSRQSQARSLRLALESQELSLMYYEQKGNDQAVARTTTILTLLRERLRAVVSE